MFIRCKDQLLDLNRPVVMGILNLTPDSFYAGSRIQQTDVLLQQAETMLTEGAAILDLGGASSRPGAPLVEEDEELKRVMPAVEAVVKHFPHAILSVDTWRAKVAQEAVKAGVSLVNDISAGNLDPELLPVVAELGCPYILMHMKGKPENMQVNPGYEDVVTAVLDFFIVHLNRLRKLGIHDVILDPGFGFGKGMQHNFALLKALQTFTTVTGLPVLAGLSRKTMIWKTLGITAEEALNGTTALNMAALIQGARILRVHDVKEAIQVISLYERL